MGMDSKYDDEFVIVSGLCVSVGRGGLDRGLGLRLGHGFAVGGCEGLEPYAPQSTGRRSKRVREGQKAAVAVGGQRGRAARLGVRG